MARRTIKKILFSILVVFIFVGCSMKNSVYSIDNRVLNLGKNKDNFISVKLNNPTFKRHVSRCVLDSYTLIDRNLKYGNLFVESIDLDSDCSWNGLPSSYFESSLISELKLQSLETVESFDINGYSFKTFKVNNDSYLNMIYIYGNTDRFILDYYGRLYDEVLKTFKPDYVNKYLAKKRFLGQYDDSLARKSIVNHYFKRERFIVSPRFGISLSL